MQMKSRQGVAPGEYYHIFNRGAHRQPIFLDKNDWQRFLFGLIYLQSPQPFKNISRVIRGFSTEAGFPVKTNEMEQVLEKRFVELSAFCLMPNHYHLIVQEREEGGIARYMQRVSDGYTKYFNEKYDRSGYVFQGAYRAVRVTDNRQLTYLSAYIHRNPRELKGWRGKEFEYPWSSLQDYTVANRWGGLLATDIIAGQFGATKNSNYADFVRTSTAKIFKNELKELPS
jgi:putative transposase